MEKSALGISYCSPSNEMLTLYIYHQLSFSIRSGIEKVQTTRQDSGEGCSEFGDESETGAAEGAAELGMWGAEVRLSVGGFRIPIAYICKRLRNQSFD